MTGGRWRRYHEPKFPRNERKILEERLQQLTTNRGQEDLRYKIAPQHKWGLQPQRDTSNNGQWTHFGRWTGQSQSNRAKTTDPAHRQHQRVKTTTYQTPWKKGKSTHKQIKTPRSWKYQQ